jgi:hypothetical protein
MIKRSAAFALLAGFAVLAFAQLRTIPDDAKRGVMRHVQETVVEIDGKRRLLSAGAQIRGESNRILVPAAVPPDSVVKYRLDQQGLVRQVWLLTPQEAAAADTADKAK